MKSANWLRLKKILFGGGDLNMEGWFKSMEDEKVGGPVNTTLPGQRIPMRFSDPVMQRRYDAGACVECGGETAPCRLCGSVEEPTARFFNNAGQEVSLEAYLEEQSKIDRFRTHYTDMAARHGWNKDDGEGPVDFLLRQAYSTGHADAIAREGRVLVNAQLLSEAADAIQLLAERQSDTESGEWWTKHYGTIAGEFRRMLAKAHKSLQ